MQRKVANFGENRIIYGFSSARRQTRIGFCL